MGRVSEEVCYQLSQGKFPPVPARGTEEIPQNTPQQSMKPCMNSDRN